MVRTGEIQRRDAGMFDGMRLSNGRFISAFGLSIAGPPLGKTKLARRSSSEMARQRLDMAGWNYVEENTVLSRISPAIVGPWRA